MRTLAQCLAWSFATLSRTLAQTTSVHIAPATPEFDTDNIAFIYGQQPSLVANDGSAADGGFRAFAVKQNGTFTETCHRKTGRSKIAVPVYDVGGRDLIINVPAPDSRIRIFDASSGETVGSNDKTQLGDWSTACVWRSEKSGESYLFLFGKKMVVQFLVRAQRKIVVMLEVQTFPVPIEGESCAVISDGKVLFSAEDRPLYSFQALESTVAPVISEASKDIKGTGLAPYYGRSLDYLLVAHEDSIDVFDETLQLKGTIALRGISKLSIKGGLCVLQSSIRGYPSGVFAFAFEGENAAGVAVGGLDGALQGLGIEENTRYNPSNSPCTHCQSPVTEKCSRNGFENGNNACSCFPGFSGPDCSKITCKDACSDHGECAGPNVCRCKEGWAGPTCSFVAVRAKCETEANGGDGDDPAIWIHPTRPDQSTIITTTKSSDGQGFGVFNLQGKLLQHLTAKEPNNVDIIYNFTAGDRIVDLAYAACRGDDTLCLVEINSTGLVKPIRGGTQALPKDYKPYGSCNYHSRKTGREYLFVNNKKAQYLQYELTATTSGTLQTTLVREFQGGSGGQVEGCVADEGAGFLFIGEEPLGIWRYEAEPEGSTTGVQIAKVGDASGLHADVEGLTLVPAKNGPGGYLMVSSQGISSYFVYERAPPHDFVVAFTIVENEAKGIDRVSNTDGIAAVGNALNGDFPGGLVVTHDDANEVAGGGTAREASFKFSSLADVLGRERVKQLGY